MLDTQQTDENPQIVEIDLDAPLSIVLQEVERLYLARVMTLANGNKCKAADLAGLHRNTFNRKLSCYTQKATFSLE